MMGISIVVEEGLVWCPLNIHSANLWKLEMYAAKLLVLYSTEVFINKVLLSLKNSSILNVHGITLILAELIRAGGRTLHSEGCKFMICIWKKSYHSTRRNILY
jgi:hypothetical protein